MYILVRFGVASGFAARKEPSIGFHSRPFESGRNVALSECTVLFTATHESMERLNTLCPSHTTHCELNLLHDSG